MALTAKAIAKDARQREMRGLARAAVQACGGDVAAAARKLRVSSRYVYQLLREAGARRRLPRFTPEEKAEILRRWNAGETMTRLGVAYRRSPHSIYTVIIDARLDGHDVRKGRATWQVS